MPHARTACALIASLPLFLQPVPAAAQIAGTTRVASVGGPIFATHAPGDTDRLFIATRNGAIRVLDLTTGALLPTPFLSIPGVSTSGEGGLLGLAFHPDYAANGKFYVNVTQDDDGEVFQGASAPFSNYVHEYTVSAGDPNVASAASQRQLLEIPQPQNNHNGGWIGFSPNDDYLYIGVGDGGSGNDTGAGHTPSIGNAQDLYLEASRGAPASRNLLGKMLRIDVNGDDYPAETDRNYAIPSDNPFVGGEIVDDEIWAYGLRNPFRNSFDRQLGDLWIADVGQGVREEINFQPADSTGGENYGWRLREGDIQTPSSGIGGPIPPDYVGPVYDYDHGGSQFSGNSVTGGYRYRGPDPSLRGQYFFADFAREHVWRFDPADPDATVENINTLITADVGTVDQIAAFGEDADGNLYIVDLGGQVFRMNTAIMITGDYDGSGLVDDADYAVWAAQLGDSGALTADGNADGVVDAADYTVWRDNYGRSLPGSTAATPAPEPAGSALWAAAALAWGVFRRRKTLPR
ncbi:Soluble aldose sugar dehydrogenase YliI precursor [Posidoniimonas polymericola]|uniref:Soluble aldose sugar dehydrogenase YliI n=1 Tax=Posidoniimonas polymericola TaxID=2528002 RepID=A0A5C5XWG0_9BACT|nr:PQQ-dependent sugar dehydrogenase [Posidoniimonas polymericola]TWT66819.1 Soluble aldose sugar dehydrogenase YliI precursor [Posidoniimonas polymericola]